MSQEGEQRSPLFSRIREGLQRTRRNFTLGLEQAIFGERKIDAALLEEIETQLIMADVGVDATRRIVEHLTRAVQRKELGNAEALYEALRAQLVEILAPCVKPLEVDAASKPWVILMVGVNGAGKTTTIGKLAHRLGREGRSVMLAAGDTYRAAAVEQLQAWGERNRIAVVAQHTGADSASVIYDAVESARARRIDVLIADTAGRLQTKDNLMEELRKVARVMKKLDPAAPHEVLLVIDGTTGQNALQQARQFREVVDVTGLVLTKLDGTAKGGMIFAVATELGLPIRFICTGEQLEDLHAFDAQQFVAALLAR